MTNMTLTELIVIWKKCLFCAGFVLAACFVPFKADAGVIFVSATAPASQFPAIAVSNNPFAQQALGVRFQITQTTQVDAIGVWVYHNNFTGPGLFGEIFPLADMSSFPTSDPYSSSGLGRTSFAASSLAQPSDLVAPLSLTLTPGFYALVIGSVANSEWGIPLNGADSVGVTSANYIAYFGGSSFPNPPYPKWQQGSDGMRFFIDATSTAIPEPSTQMLLGLGCCLLMTLRAVCRSRKARQEY